MKLWQLVAREQIREVTARYAHCADSGRFAELVDLFADDGGLEIHGREPLHGRPAILAFLTATKTSRASTLQQPYIRHHISSLTIDVHNAASASAASYFLAITERGPDHWGRYKDQLVRVGDCWLFQHRKVRPDALTSSGDQR